MATKKKSIDAPRNTLAIEREGKVTTWTLLVPARHRAVASERDAYERGFRAYVQDFNQGVTAAQLTTKYRKASDQDAYEQGYVDAQAGGVVTDVRPPALAPRGRRK